MKTIKKAFIAIVLPCLIFQSASTFAQKSDRQISVSEQKQIIDTAFRLLKTNYIFPGVIPSMEKIIYQKISGGAYAKFSTAEEFIKNVNMDLEQLSKDRHVNIFFDPVRVKQIQAEAKGDYKQPGYAPAFLQRAKYENYMVRKAERLDGNVGYIKFNAFVDPELAKNTLVSAMNFVANSNALIIDLRQNGGGDARTLSFLLSYFLPDSTLISERRSRATTTVSYQYLNHDPLVNKFNNEVPVYILVSKRTSSAAEAFAYTLQTYKRATIIGEITNGEANPGYLFALNAEMYIMIPAFESIHPITKTNWQGSGVTPDINVQADKALTMAQATAYKSLAKLVPVAELKSMYEWMADGLQAELQPVSLSTAELKQLEGDFADDRHVNFVNDALYYYRGSDANNKKKLFPIKQDVFGLESVPYFRLRFVKNEKQEIIAVEGIYDDGKKELSHKQLSKATAR
jgi:retinol-binding protein 3